MKEGKPHILVADDEKEIRDVLRLLLTGEGYTVTEAADGDQVLAAASPAVDLYLLDVNMPGISGILAAVELRRQYDAPIVFLTAYGSETDKIMGFSAGADDYVVKPFSSMELLMRLRAILRRNAPRAAAPEKENRRLAIGSRC